jgi:hypothetical protein
MTQIQGLTVKCNRCQDKVVVSGKDAKQRLSDEGWQRIASYMDLCPTCAFQPPKLMIEIQVPGHPTPTMQQIMDNLRLVVDELERLNLLPTQQLFIKNDDDGRPLIKTFVLINKTEWEGNK